MPGVAPCWSYRIAQPHKKGRRHHLNLFGLNIETRKREVQPSGTATMARLNRQYSPPCLHTVFRRIRKQGPYSRLDGNTLIDMMRDCTIGQGIINELNTHAYAAGPADIDERYQDVSPLLDWELNCGSGRVPRTTRLSLTASESAAREDDQ
jgi:hypothetical protein